MKVLVCGGRDYNNVKQIYDTLDEVKPTMVIHGDAPGADSIAGEWARENGVQEVICPANWNSHGKQAGIKRNYEMLRLLPDRVVAFPGGKGTAHMVSAAEFHRIPVRKIKENYEAIS